MQYRIICTNQVPSHNHPENAKIVSVEVAGLYHRETMTVSEVVRRIGQGDSFYTQDNRSGKRAGVGYYWCSRCQENHIRSKPDATTSNNLDSLPKCQG